MKGHWGRKRRLVPRRLHDESLKAAPACWMAVYVLLLCFAWIAEG
jgi:hypothetical protein